jgi:ribosomal protein L11 methyltransferase
VHRQELSLIVDAASAPLAETLLELAGAESVALRDAADEALLEPAPGTTPLWSRVRLTALFAADRDLNPVRDALAAALPPGTAVDWRELNDRDLTGPLEPICERLFGDRLALIPADRPPAHSELAQLRLHMGLAFGTGQHPTTALCLDWLATNDLRGLRVLDYGCGTGVLALAALALGAQSACAVDIEPQALEATARNARLNGLEARIRTFRPDEFAAAGEGTFDLICANILAAPLQTLAGRFRELLAAGGRIVLSGLLPEQCRAVQAAYADAFTAFEVETHEGWARISASLADRIVL